MLCAGNQWEVVWRFSEYQPWIRRCKLHVVPKNGTVDTQICTRTGAHTKALCREACRHVLNADACSDSSSSRRRRRQASDYHDVQPYIVPPCTLSLSLSLHTLFSWRELNREMPLAQFRARTAQPLRFPISPRSPTNVLCELFFFFLKNPFLFLLRPSQFLYLHNIEKNTPSIPVGWLIRGSLPFHSLTLSGRNIWVRVWKGLWSWLE
jgi:hypothetical protein